MERIKDLSTDEIKRRLEAALRLNKGVPGLRSLGYQDALRKRARKEKK